MALSTAAFRPFSPFAFFSAAAAGNASSSDPPSPRCTSSSAAATTYRASCCSFSVTSFDSDWRFDTGHSRRIVRTLEHAGASVTFREIRSPWGHDSFLLVVPGYHETISAFLNADTRHVRSGTAVHVPGRPDLDVVAGLVPDGSRVLDIGCGDGDLPAQPCSPRSGGACR